VIELHRDRAVLEARVSPIDAVPSNMVALCSPGSLLADFVALEPFPR
jgi:hypothetical protein